MHSKYRAKRKVICLHCLIYYDLAEVKRKAKSNIFQCLKCGADILTIKVTQKGIIANSVKGNSIIPASEKEARKYIELSILEKKGMMPGFLYQVPFWLVNNISQKGYISYIADFVIFADDAPLVAIGSIKNFIYRYKIFMPKDLKKITHFIKEIIDTKGFKTKLYELKKALMYERYGIEIKEE